MKIIQNFLIIILLLTANQASAAVSLSVNNEDIPKTKILFLGFDAIDPKLKTDSFEIIERIRRNLKTTDLFEIVKQSGQIEMVEKPAATKVVTKNAIKPSAATPVPENISIEAAPNFEKYNKLGISAIVVGQVNYDSEGSLEIRVRMWDVLDQRQFFGKAYTASRDNYRKVSNLISDEIFKAVTGEKIGHFSSKIIYISETGPITKRIKKVSGIDFDGENQFTLTDGRDLVLTPIFSKKSDEIFYLRYFEGRPQIFNFNLKTGRQQKVGSFKGTTFSAAVHPASPNIILLSAIIDENSDIYEMDILNNSAKRLTKSPAIDTTPSYSPSGKEIAFISDREDGQQIYIMNSDGSSAKRISFGSGSYSKPVYSPDGKLIAFTKIKGNQFYIGTMLPNGKGEKLLTNGYLVEGAKWSPNGRYIIYSKKKGQYGQDSIPHLFIIDIITGYEILLPTPKNEGASDPDWASL